ncbi:MAG: helix-turn-helix domain-containing protein, partial [Pseudomonadota bacterium]
LQPADFPQISGLSPKLETLPDVPAAANDADPALTVSTGSGPVEIFDPHGELRKLEDVERDLLQFAIDHYDGHMSEVSRRLGIGRSTLYRKVRDYDLKVREDREAG